MSTIKKRPVYVREWFKTRKEEWLSFVTKRLVKAQADGTISEWLDELRKDNKSVDAKHIKFNELDGDIIKKLGFNYNDETCKGDFSDPEAEYEIDDEAYFDSDEEEWD